MSNVYLFIIFFQYVHLSFENHFLAFQKKKKIPSDIPLRRPVRNIHSFQSRGRLSSALAQERDFAVDRHCASRHDPRSLRVHSCVP